MDVTMTIKSALTLADILKNGGEDERTKAAQALEDYVSRVGTEKPGAVCNYIL